MHATIAAFSSGTAVIPVSYSRKFEGLYETAGYPYLIDCTKMNEEEALERTMAYIANIDELGDAVRDALAKAHELNRAYKAELTELIGRYAQ